MNRPIRYAFWALWFFLVPLLLAVAAVWLLTPADAPEPVGFLGRVRYFVQEQPIPAGIILFTVFEILLYGYRHSLPLASYVAVGGRTDIPQALRASFEEAQHLLDEAERLMERRKKELERKVPQRKREELGDALAKLRDVMRAEKLDEDDFVEAQDRAAQLVKRHLGQWRKSEFREYAESIFLAVAVALLLRFFVVEAFKIPSGSMLPTLQIQDHIFVNKFLYGPTIPGTRTRLWHSLPPSRGDVIVFEAPPSSGSAGDDFIKRVIAVEGDELVVEDGHPIINGWKVPNCRVGSYGPSSVMGGSGGDLFIEFLGSRAYLTQFEHAGMTAGREGPYQVKEGELWVMGDNRNNSSDSRAWNGRRGAGVPFPNIKGRAMFVWMAASADRILVNVLGRPRLPRGAPADLLAGIERCLSQRPANTLPPPPNGARK